MILNIMYENFVFDCDQAADIARSIATPVGQNLNVWGQPPQRQPPPQPVPWTGPIPAAQYQTPVQDAYVAPPWFIDAAQREMDKQAENWARQLQAVDEEKQSLKTELEALKAEKAAQAAQAATGGLPVGATADQQPVWHTADQNQQSWSGTDQQSGSGSGSGGQKRRRDGKICFACYQGSSYHGQGSCSNTSCPLNGGSNPFFLLYQLKDMGEKISALEVTVRISFIYVCVAFAFSFDYY